MLVEMMFREMRRGKQQLSAEETKAVLKRGSHGVIACLGDEGYPYAVPVNYVYYENKLYFHSAKNGHKIDAITRQPKVSFAVTDEDTIVSAEYTSYFRSVIIFGEARITSGEEWTLAFRALVEKYSADQPEEAKQKEVRECGRSLIIAIDIAHATGKEAIEYVNARESMSH